MENKTLYTLKCKGCGELFEWTSKNKRVCPTCDEIREERKKERKREKYRSVKLEKAKQKKTSIDFSITELVRIMEKYNREHKTKYTYGQFVELLRCGKINIAR